MNDLGGEIPSYKKSNTHHDKRSNPIQKRESCDLEICPTCNQEMNDEALFAYKKDHYKKKVLERSIFQMNEKIQLSNQKILRLEKKLYQSKILLNMIIHDMRSPTSSIKSGLEQVNLRLMENKKMRKQLTNFEISNSKLLQNLSDLCNNIKDQKEYLDSANQIPNVSKNSAQFLEYIEEQRLIFAQNSKI